MMDAERLLEGGPPLCKHVSKVLFLPNKGKAKLLKGSNWGKKCSMDIYTQQTEVILENERHLFIQSFFIPGRY